MLIEIGSEVIRFALPTKSDDKVSIGFKLSMELRFSFRTFSLDKFTMEEVTSSYRPDNTRCYRCRSRSAFILESNEAEVRVQITLIKFGIPVYLMEVRSKCNLVKFRTVLCIDQFCL